MKSKKPQGYRAVDWVLLSQHALHDEYGLLHVMGIFDAVEVASFPATHPAICVCFSITGKPGERIQYTVTPHHPNGEMDRTHTHQVLIAPGRDRAEAFVVLHRFEFREFGVYRFVISTLRGSHEARLTIRRKPATH